MDLLPKILTEITNNRFEHALVTLLNRQENDYKMAKQRLILSSRRQKPEYFREKFIIKSHAAYNANQSRQL